MEEVFEDAHLVFVGTALAEPSPDVWIAPYWRLGFTTFEVEETFKDDYGVGDSGRVSLYRPEHNCAASFDAGRRYLVFAWRTEGQLAESSYCAGNEVVTEDSESLARVRAVAAGWSPPLAPAVARGETRQRGEP